MKDKLVSVCDKIINYFNWDLEEETREFKQKGSRTITREEDLKIKVYRARSNSENYGVGITSLYNSIAKQSNFSTSFSDYVTASSPAHFTQERIYHLTTYLNIIGEIVEIYEEWNSSEFNQLVHSLQDHELFGKDKISIDPKILEKVDNLFTDRDRFKAYKYRVSKETLVQGDSFNISKKIYFSQDLALYLKHISTQKEFLECQPKNQVFVTLFGKLDEISWIYSNWIVTVHKGDSIWIVTDQVNFDNPGQKKVRLSRKSIWETQEEKSHGIDLPYELFEDQSQLRANTKNLATETSYSTISIDYIKEAEQRVERDASFNIVRRRTEIEAKSLFQKDLEKRGFADVLIDINYTDPRRDEVKEMIAVRSGRTVGYYNNKEKRAVFYKNPEFLQMNTKDLEPGHKVFLTMLVSKIIEEISITNDSLDRIELSSDFVTRKLLEGVKIDPMKPTHMEHWSPQAQKIFKDINKNIDIQYGKGTALTLKSYGSVINCTDYNSNWLATPKNQESLIEWMILKNEVSPLIDKLKSFKKDNQNLLSVELLRLFKKQEGAVFERAFQSIETDVLYKDYESSLGSFDSEMNMDWRRVLKIVNKEDDNTLSMRRGIGIGKYANFDLRRHSEEENCTCCDSVVTKVSRVASIYHYEGLLYLLGLDSAEDLPLYYRNYRAHTMIPYTGNSLIQQTHPYLDLIEEDPCSNEHPNGITLRIYTCGRCRTKLLKDKPLELEIKI